MIKELHIDRCNLAEATIKGDGILIQIAFHRAMPLATCEANAHLIAASPTMYQALMTALFYLAEPNEVTLNRMREVIVAAIYKAEGKEGG